MLKLEEQHALLLAFRRGDRLALDEVYRAYAERLWSMLRQSRAAKTELLEHVLQETFIRAFSETARKNYDGVRPYEKYLYAIARNVLIDTHRSLESHQALEDEHGTLDEDDTLTPEELALQRELQALCQSFVEELPEDEKALFELRFSKGQSVEQCAKQLGWSEHRVKRDEKVLRKRFFVTLNQQNYFEGYRLSDRGLERILALVVLFCAANHGVHS